MDKNISEIALVEELCTALAKELAIEIRRAITSAKVAEPVYCLTIAWSPGQPYSLPPLIGLGLQSERSEWIAEHGVEAKDYLWNPAEFSTFDSEELEIDGTTLEHLSKVLNKKLGETGEWSAGLAMLNSVAKELGALDWGTALTTTDDFVAYAIDYELCDLRENLKFSAPNVFATLEDAGWLP
tara:strand:+ start:39257 stop:39805 length:549 start_codon:yes stop_codon:yes gene_type:complete